MTVEERARLSCYREIAYLNMAHGVTLVQDSESGLIFVKKMLSIYNREVYDYIKRNPIDGIPKIYEIFEDEGQLILIEEYINAESLQSWLDRRGVFSESKAIEIICRLCDIVFRMHSQNPAIVHRDIKPSNVLLSEDGEVSLIDLNAAKPYSGDKNRDTRLLGTAGFAAPEQYGFGASNIQTDIYALGVLLNVLISGKMPHERLAGGKIGEVVLRCTQMESDKRYRSAKDLAKALGGKMPGRAYKSELQRYALPGFRTGNVSHAIIALTFYALIAFVSLSIKFEGMQGLEAAISKIILAMGMLAVVLFTFNWRDVQEYAGLTSIHNKAIRIFLVFLLDLCIFFCSIILLAIVDGIL